MRISWLSAEEILAARRALTANGATWDDHFLGRTFATPATPSEGAGFLDWDRITEHVARAERVSAVVREQGLDAARARFAGSGVAIEEATLAAAAHEQDALSLEQVIEVLSCEIDHYVFYAPFLELMIEKGRDQLDRTLQTYERFVASYAEALGAAPHGAARVGAVKDGLADFYVTAGRVDAANELFERRHEEDQNDVAVALSASRAFLASGQVSHAVRWLGVGAARATALGRDELAKRLLAKQAVVRNRMS